MVDQEMPENTGAQAEQAAPVIRTVREVQAPKVPFKENAEVSSAVADQFRRAAATGGGGGLGAGGDRGGGNAALLPNTNGERPFVQVRLPDGRTLTLAQPEVMVGFIIGRILGPQDSSNSLSVGYAKALLYVAELDGQAVKRPSSPPELQGLANAIGDQNLDLVMQVYAKYFGAPVDLEEVKKNLPG